MSYARVLSALEEKLGPAAGPGPFGLSATLARDEAEAFPAEALAALRELGASGLLVPREHGGAFEGFDAALAAAHAVSRRDPSVALSQGMLAWLWLAWMAGTEAQRVLARRAVARGETPCFAASERAHGADLLATETLAVDRGGAWEITGEKWPIGGAGPAALAFVLARTRREPGPRALSWFVVDLSAAGSTVARLPKVRTLGLRASDLSGLRFARAPATLVGAEGQGLELTLRIFQITRPLMAGLGLGAAHTALAHAAAFAGERRLYRGKASDLPPVREELGGAWLDLIAAEVLLLSTARALHVAPEEMSLAAPLAKALAPALTERTLRAARTVLGARAFLREGDTGIFQKMARDHEAVGLIDGSMPVCLAALAAEWPLAASSGGGLASPRARFALGEELPPFDAARLTLTARGRDGVLADLPGWLEDRRRDLGATSPALAYAKLHAAACCVRFEEENAHLPACREGLPSLAARRLALEVSGEEQRAFEVLSARGAGASLSAAM